MVRTSTPLLVSLAVIFSLLAARSVAQTEPLALSHLRPIPYPITAPPAFRAALEVGTRSPTGEPGPAYWQQWTRYELTARLDPRAKQLEGQARIVYHNRSPDVLPTVSLHLLQNLHAPGVIRNESQEITGGVELGRIVAQGTELQEGAPSGSGYEVQGTILSLRLPAPLRPGDSLELEIDWQFAVPQSGAGRMGWSRDNLFFIAYWYPQMAAYDDVVGWHLDPYLGNAEFYTGFGSYRLAIEVPEGWVVTGTGELENAAQVLPQTILQRLDRASHSDTVVHVLTAQDFGPGRATQRSASGWLTWRFTADTVRDVAISVTRESLWDAARTPVGDRNGDGQPDYARIDALYRETAPRWRETWRYAQHAIDFLSRWTAVSYPWPHMTAIEGGGIIGGGMEFPMMTLMGDYNQRGDSSLYYVTAHELAHMWVPMIVGTDEKRYAWMDEGTTSFNENQARKEFFPGVDHDDPDRRSYLGVALAEGEGELMRHSEYHYPGAYGVASYSKPASILAALRGLLGDEAFLRAYRAYLGAWAFKHPKPWDFFNTFNTVSGQNLDWFWRSWYYETWVLDQAVAAVTTEATATSILIEDRGLVPMPARLTITFANGETLTREVPVATWLAGHRTATVTVRTGSPVIRVEIDAARVFPDAVRENNVWVK